MQREEQAESDKYISKDKIYCLPSSPLQILDRVKTWLLGKLSVVLPHYTNQ
jgi:hypothetical protein